MQNILPLRQDGPAKNNLQGVGLIARSWTFSPLFFWEGKKRHTNALGRRATAPANLDPLVQGWESTREEIQLEPSREKDEGAYRSGDGGEQPALIT